MLLLNLILLIDVTFSTPTPVYNNHGWHNASGRDFGSLQMIVLVNCFEVWTVARASLFFVAAETFAIPRRSLRCIDERSMRDYRP
jgi:hypothetical protein